MKHILIAGANSYIGESFKNWAEKEYPHEFAIDTVDLIDKGWREKSFSGYDVVFHVAGIVHQKEKPDMKALYRKVNIELPVEVAGKAKSEGVKQFVFMSSMSVYGKNVGRIQRDDSPIPTTYYGKSKLQAEKRLRALESESFKIAILRPPMVYGKGCKGNYQLLKKFVERSPIFPAWKNERSMLHIDVLSEFLVQIMKEEAQGLYFPQNDRYECTAELAKGIAEENGKKIRFTKLFNGGIWLGLKLRIAIIEKVFGTLVYETEI